MKGLLHYVKSFWVGLITEGPRETLKPRWGALTYAYLNDGIKPSAWHTIHSVIGDEGIYVHGAPKGRAEADRINAGLDPRYPNYKGDAG